MAHDPPKRARINRNRFFDTESRSGVLEALCANLGTREPFLLITGDVGTGKSAVAREVIRRWGPRARVALISNPALSRAELVEEISRRFGLEPPDGASKSRLLACVERVVTDAADRHKVPVIVIDDAHDLSVELLSELRYLVNDALSGDRSLEVLLVGLPELEMRLDDPSLLSLRQQISVRARTELFTQDETRRFLREVMNPMAPGEQGLFSGKVCRQIHEQSRGVVRTIQSLAGERLRDIPVAEAPAAEAATASFVETEVPRTVPRPQEEPAAVERRPLAAPVPPAPKDPLPPIEPPERSSDEPSVQSWVERFIAADEPRFGELLMADPSHAGADAQTDDGKRLDSEPAYAPASAPARGATRRRRRGRHGRATLVTTAAVVTLIATAVGFLLPRMRGATKAGTNSQAAAISDTAADSSAKRAASAPAADQAPATAADPIKNYALDVGSYRDGQAAEIERERLTQATGLKGWVIRETDQQGDVFQVVLGVYSSRQRATWGAGLLKENKLVDEVKLIPLPPRSKRR